MDTILHADPKAVKDAMEAEKRANAERRAQASPQRAKRLSAVLRTPVNTEIYPHRPATSGSNF
jgi:hypothetical protein